jgi:hypothetical protein
MKEYTKVGIPLELSRLAMIILQLSVKWSPGWTTMNPTSQHLHHAWDKVLPSTFSSRLWWTTVLFCSSGISSNWKS